MCPLNIWYRAVKSRITEIRRKMDASNVTAAVFRAQEMGYIRL